MYDRRPFLDWYGKFAEKRNGDRKNIAIDASEHADWLRLISCSDNKAVMKGLYDMWKSNKAHATDTLGNILQKLVSAVIYPRDYSVPVKKRTKKQAIGMFIDWSYNPF